MNTSPIKFLLTLVATSLMATATERPNIIIIMADDVGYGDISAYGADAFETPHIDQLATGGLRFTSGYASASTCTPTRYSLMTGTYAFRKKGTGIAPPNGALVIDPDTFTLPDLLKQSGYATAVIGKWHLGLGKKGIGPDWNGELKPGPLEIGFDYAFLLPTTNDRVPQVYVENHRVKNLDPNDPLWVGDKKPSADHPTGRTHRDSLKMDWSHGHNDTIHNGISRIGFYTGGHTARFRDEDLAYKWIDESRHWITANKDGPFFLFFASHDNHVPRIPHERFQGVSGLGPRADSILQLDWSVGELMKILEEAGISENTLIVFCSDNGPVLDDGYKDDAKELLGLHQPNGPWSGGKYSVYEGGTRTPFITYWPGRIQPGIASEIVSTVDLLASFAALTGQPLPDDQALDSINVLDALTGVAGAPGRDSQVQQDNGTSGKFGFRKGDWKLVRGRAQDRQPRALSNWPKAIRSVRNLPDRLYYLAEDPAELFDLASEKPAKLAELQSELDAIIAAGRSR
jgi:arylsulfatase A